MIFSALLRLFTCHMHVPALRPFQRPAHRELAIIMLLRIRSGISFPSFDPSYPPC